MGLLVWMCIIGSVVMGIGYVYFGVYFFLLLFGVDVGSVSIVLVFVGLLGVVKMGIKFVLVWLFFFYFCNGIK